jgi:SAM-dependent methyltransferase
MPLKRTAGDWTPETVRRFWEWHSTRPERQKRYFSRQVGDALVRVLELAGGLRGNILDFGCGPGYLMEQMCGYDGVTCHGVDYSTRSVEEARKRLAGVKSLAAVEVIRELPAPFPDAHFDSLTCIETIEHLSDGQLRALLAEVYRLLKPDAVAMFTTPCNEDLEGAQTYCPFCESEFHNMQHVRVFSPDQLRTLLARIGFHVLYCDGLDLRRFQQGQHRKLVDWSMRDTVVSLVRLARWGVAAMLDTLTRTQFPDSRRFRVRVVPGPHLIAVVRKSPA